MAVSLDQVSSRNRGANRSHVQKSQRQPSCVCHRIGISFSRDLRQTRFPIGDPVGADLGFAYRLTLFYCKALNLRRPTVVVPQDPSNESAGSPPWRSRTHRAIWVSWAPGFEYKPRTKCEISSRPLRAAASIAIPLRIFGRAKLSIRGD